MSELRHDEIGYWSEIKLDIVKDYATEYSKILSAQTKPTIEHIYIDAFAGSGKHLSKTSKEFVPGSPLNALLISPPFKEFHFIDLNQQKVASLHELVGSRSDVHIYEGDCNAILENKVFPKAHFDKYRRALCLLDPYGLHLNWQIIKLAGQMKSIEIFLNFPVMDMNRNVLWRDPERVDPSQVDRMSLFWGDDSWRAAAYDTQQDMFNYPIKNDNAAIVTAFRERLKHVAGFTNVPEPLPMRNKSGATVYYLFFASQRPVAQKIVSHIFNKYSTRGA